MSCFHYDRQDGTCYCKSNRNYKELENNILIICRYLNLVKKSEDDFIAKRKFTSCYNIKIVYRL